MTANFITKAFAIDISQSKITAAKGELVVKIQGISEPTRVYYVYLHEKLTEKGYKVTVINPLHSSTP
ncbi:conserved hypothetical protein [Sulfolobus islandicus M.14.25]|uniref:Uncharacterized protein n=1 Tax=Saccharolobus islandicus (strain M.14.25 / Kamchatka \|nr:conserved hypothetical protein [Sulfolobus islandicus M.14.25]